MEPSKHVLSNFKVADSKPTLLSGGQGQSWKCDNIVLKPVENVAEATWIAEKIGNIQSDAFRLPKPISTINGE